jgi:hypothetical protein
MYRFHSSDSPFDGEAAFGNGPAFGTSDGDSDDNLGFDHVRNHSSRRGAPRDGELRQLFCQIQLLT